MHRGQRIANITARYVLTIDARTGIIKIVCTTAIKGMAEEILQNSHFKLQRTHIW